MIVAHVGPPPRRIGGPAGYLHQLQSGASTDRQPRHVVRFPQPATLPEPPSSPPLSLLTRLRRKVIGPKFYRPSVKELSQSGGLVDRMLRDIAAGACAESQASLAAATSEADVIFTHDPFSTEAALRERATGQQVWMMCHGVTPIAVYAVWSWGIPEADWRSFLDYPDVRRWIDWELAVWSRA